MRGNLKKDSLKSEESLKIKTNSIMNENGLNIKTTSKMKLISTMRSTKRINEDDPKNKNNPKN